MRVYSYLFHALFGLFLFGISLIALLSGTELHLEMAPWSGSHANLVLLGCAALGLLTLLLALTGAARWPFFLWSLAVFILLAKGFFLSNYHFDGTSGFKSAALLTAGSLLALFGAWFQMTRRRATAKI